MFIPIVTSKFNDNDGENLLLNKKIKMEINDMDISINDLWIKGDTISNYDIKCGKLPEVIKKISGGRVVLSYEVIPYRADYYVEDFLVLVTCKKMRWEK